MSKKSAQKSSGSSFFYMTLWVISAMGAIGYIAYLMEQTAPNLKSGISSIKSFDAITNGRSITGSLSTKRPGGQTTLAEIHQELAKTNRSLKEINIKYYGLNDRISELKNNVAAIKANNSRLHNRVYQIESAINPVVTGSLNGVQKRTAKQTLDQQKIQQAIKDSQLKKNNKKTNAKSENKKSKMVITTKSIPGKLIKPTDIKPVIKQPEKLALNIMPHPVKKQVPEITRTQFAVSLGNYPDLKRLKKAWQILNKKYASTLSPLKPRYVTMVVDNQAQYKLVSGPLNNALDAAKICFHLQQSKTYCKQTIFHGSGI